jgi:hypothetical protein
MGRNLFTISLPALMIAALGICMLLSFLLLSSAKTDDNGVASWVSRKLRLAKAAKAAPVESQAIDVLSTFFVDNWQQLPYAELASMLFATSLADASDAKSVLLKLIPDYDVVPAFLDGTTFGDHSVLQPDPRDVFAGSTHDVCSNFILASKRAWDQATPAETALLRPALKTAANTIMRQINTDGYYIVHSTAAEGSIPTGKPLSVNDPEATHRVSTLRHVQALAALRAAFLLLGSDNLAHTSALMVRRLHDMYDPWPATSPAALPEDFSGPFHVGLLVQREGNKPVQPIRGLCSDLGLLLLYLEPGDVPRAALGRLAASLASLETPIGVRTGRQVFDYESGTPGARKHKWMVSGIDQLGILYGASKHLRHELALLSKRAAGTLPNARPSPIPRPQHAEAGGTANKQPLSDVADGHDVLQRALDEGMESLQGPRRVQL